jgi:CRP-like cAMP-binding protein
VLSALPPEQLNQIHGLTFERLEQRQPLWEPHEPIRAVYFPITCVTSIIATDDEGGEVEVSTVGNEGMAGLPVFLGAETTPQRAFTQVSGDSYRLDTPLFLRLIEGETELRRLLHLYTQGFVAQVSQSVACNRLHDQTRRLARWLLMCHDRVGRDEFGLTHEFMSQMLGVRRATVTEAAGALQAAGVIQYSRGVVEVIDRQGLEQASCPCYKIVRDEFDRLLVATVG